ncbi:PREDICTED: uncharacterized protein LOC109237593 [Nicotiana attenuata]|uniref:uncharacterized protein LOC109237593 n=1 Tax=Nicotiana attenuata TaxID=49451 RepID=UPI0009057C61|nr:PREDICTED: uncharacterized protein LOC109237593 [Nicotiana attenuata]
MWVYKVKHQAYESIERFKVRLVVKGYTQQAGVDYIKTFSHVVKLTTVRDLISTAVNRKWIISQLDVNNAFLHGDLHEEVYMEIPSGLEVPTPGVVCRLNKSLYGLKQASTQWKSALDLLKGYDCMSYSGLSSPLDRSVKLQAKVGVVLNDPTYYRKLVGKLNFLTNTMLDIAYGVQHLSQFMQDPREPHLKAAFHLLWYLRSDPTLGIFFSNDRDCTIQAYYDSDWATCLDSKRLLEELPVPFPKPVIVFCDSQSALHIARNSVFHDQAH